MRKERPVWYLTSVKNKENKDWTLDERILVLTLREKGVSSSEIAEKINATKIQIYNATRIARKVIVNRCYVCGNDLTTEELKVNAHRKTKICFTCKNKSRIYKKELRMEAIKKGFCGYCLKRKVIPGTKSCKRCVSATHRRRYILGICGICGELPIDKKHSITMCSSCLLQARINAKYRREQYADNR